MACKDHNLNIMITSTNELLIIIERAMVLLHRDGSACYHGEYQFSLQALLQGSCQGCGHRSEPSPAGDKWQWWQDAPTPKVSGEGQGGPTAAPLDTHGSRSLLTARLPC